MKAPENKPDHAALAAGRDVVAGLYQVSKHYESLWAGSLVRALIDISFEIRRGEVFGLLGPVGSGKSTTLSILAGRLSPADGRAKVFGRSPRRRSVKARLGYLPENGSRSDQRNSAGFLGFLRGLFGPILNGGRTRNAESPPALERRVALARVLHKTHDLFLLDEPLAGLDPASCHEAKELILELARSGKTVVLSSRCLSEVQGICDRAAVYFNGRVEAVGTFQELLAQPYALRFLAPVLPSTAAERLLQLVREDLGRASAPSQPKVDPAENDFNPPAAAPPPMTTSVSPAAINETLAPLLEPRASKPPLPAAQPAAAVIDHQRLAELSRPPSE